MDEFPLPHPAHHLSGQVALVTGATSGLGRRFAKVIAAAGGRVAVAGRRLDRLESLVAEIEGDGGTALACPLDVADAQALVAIVPHVEATLGAITILVNSAGVPDAQLATKISLELIDHVIAVNLRAPFVLAREIAARLVKLGMPGRIINIGSMAANYVAAPGSTLYSTTKAGVARMTEVLALEWARVGINVNAISPGVFDSEMTDGMRGRIGDEFIAAFPRQRVLAPAKLDSTLLYLLSPASDAVTGIIIKVDDGQLPR